jgi:sn-glycerol 3-phosphate transport system ATP-binding protein
LARIKPNGVRGASDVLGFVRMKPRADARYHRSFFQGGDGSVKTVAMRAISNRPRGPVVRLCSLSKSFGASPVLDRLNLDVPGGEFTVLLGGSGCGKTTCLRLIAGLEVPSSGRVFIGDRDVTALPPAARGVAMVFQSYALFPHLSAGENIMFGLRARRVARAERDRRLARATDILGLTGLLDRKPSQLSGGQQQRVALARTIVNEAPVCLMDEPLSNLDAQLRAEMRRELVSLQRRLGLTMICVTHDQVEAMSMADHVVVMRAGQVEQAGPPAEIYDRPATMFVAGFIGAPSMNLLPMERLDNDFSTPDGALVAGVRPEALALAWPSAPLVLAIVVTHREYLGGDTVLTGCLAGTDLPLQARLSGAVAATAGETVQLGLSRDAIHLFDAATGRRAETVPDHA